MADTVNEAKAATVGAVKDVTVFGGFVWGDSPDAGASILSWAETATAAKVAADEIAQQLYARREEFRTSLPSPA